VARGLSRGRENRALADFCAVALERLKRRNEGSRASVGGLFLPTGQEPQNRLTPLSAVSSRRNSSDPHFGKQELTTALTAHCTAVADIRSQCVKVGELQHPIRDGRMRLGEELTEIGDVLSGRRPGRTSETEVTLYDSTGTALQDVAVGFEGLVAAQRRGLGQKTDLGRERESTTVGDFRVLSGRTAKRPGGRPRECVSCSPKRVGRSKGGAGNGLPPAFSATACSTQPQ